jgi:hypothetical protein
MHRLLCALGSALLALTLLTTDATPAHAVAEDLPLCTDGGPRPCLVSVTRDGEALPDGYDLNGRTVTTASGRQYVALTPLHLGQDDLGAADLDATWSMTVDLGDLAPRVVTGKGADVTVERTADSSVVTVTGRPVTISGQCRRTSTSWRCPEFNPDQDDDNRDRAAILRVEIGDGTDWPWTGPAQLTSALGTEVFTNVAATAPPAVVKDKKSPSKFLRFPLGSHRFLEDGSTLVNGRLQVRLPYPLLQLLYRIPDPASMTPTSLRIAGAGAGAQTTFTNDPVGGGVLVDVTRIRFADGGSVRRVAIRRGAVTPTRPVITSAVRTNQRRGVITWTASTPRGAAIQGYESRCSATETHHVLVDPAGPDEGWEKFVGLRLEPYDCKVRALSAAGPSRWSATARIPG